MSAPEATSLPAVRAVLFDAGNTLLWIDHARIATVLTECGAPTSTEQARHAEIAARPRLDPHVRTATKRESRGVRVHYIRYFLEHLGLATDGPLAREFAERLEQEWGRLWVCPPMDAHDVLTDLAERGYRLGVVSNSNGKVDAMLRDAELAHFFEFIVDSGKEGVEKPDPRIFEIALGHLGLPASDALYIGDLLAVDVEGARGAGLHAVLLDPDLVWTPDVAPRVEGVDRVRSLTELAARLP